MSHGRPLRLPIHGALLALLCLGAGRLAARAPAGASSPQDQRPTFSSGVTAVPVDVRVIGRDGRPVTDLDGADFALFEDDVPQRVVHFSRYALVPRAPGPSLRAATDLPLFDASPPQHRVFLVVIGAGALGSRPLGASTAIQVDPAKALDGLLHLVRDRLLPQDQVALLAYNRATDFSTDHASVARVLESLRRSEAEGLASLGRLGALRPTPQGSQSAFGAGAAEGPTVESADLGLGEYLEARNRRASDAENLDDAIKYLRFVDGEKHLIYVTANGIARPFPGTLEAMQARPWQNPEQVAASAGDARVALHVIQTAGASLEPAPFLPALPVMKPLLTVPGQANFGTGGSNATTDNPGARAPAQPGWDTPPLTPGVPVPGMTSEGLMALQDLRMMAWRTGGRASIMQDAAGAVDRIDAETRAGYLLAYYPSRAHAPGREATIRVEVNRPGVTVLHRRGYRPAPEAASLNRRAVVADGRLATATASTRRSSDIAVTAVAAFARNRKGKGGELTVGMAIDAKSLAWTTDDLSRRVARLDIAVLCGDAREKVVGQTRRQVTVALTESSFAQAMAQGLPYRVRIPTSAAPRFFKLVLYNFDSDRTGSAVVAVK